MSDSRRVRESLSVVVAVLVAASLAFGGLALAGPGDGPAALDDEHEDNETATTTEEPVNETTTTTEEPADETTTTTEEPTEAPADNETTTTTEEPADGVVDNETAFVRVVHASPDAPNVDVYLDNESVLTDVSFGTVSDYLEVSAGAHTITVTAAGNRSAVVSEINATVAGGVGYTVAAAGEASPDAATSFQLLVFVDSAEQPEAGNASVRLLHLSPDAPAVDVTVAGTGDVLFDNVSFTQGTDYVAVPAGNYTLEVRPATPGDDGPVVGTFDVGVEGGTAYSALAVGYLNETAAPVDVPFDVLLTGDRTVAAMGEVTPPAGTETTTTTEEETPTEEETTTTTEEETTTTTEEETPTTTEEETTTTTEEGGYDLAT